MIARLEDFVFGHRAAILVALALFTVAMGWSATRLHMEAGFAKQLPSGHEYIETFLEYLDELSGTNRLIVVLRAREGDIWNQPFLARLEELTEAVVFLPGVDRRTVSSIWSSNTFYFEVNEEGMTADNVIPSDVVKESIDASEIARIRNNVITGDLVGRLVANDYSAAMVTAELIDVDPETEAPLDYLALADRIDREIRAPFEDSRYAVHLQGFAPLMGDIAAGAKSVVWFFALALLLTAAAVYLFARSWILTVLPLFCSLTSVVWQFGAVHLLGFGLDPLAVLVPFLVFAIGVSHGVQQINLITAELSRGANAERAARHSFSGLLVPGSMALVTGLIGFGTLVLIPIAMIQELGITALVGVGFKIVTNLFMLPILVSYVRFDARYVERVTRARRTRERVVAHLGRLAEPRHAVATVAVSAVVFALAVYGSRNRHVGDLLPGSPELRQDSRYNVDARAVGERFSFGLDVLTVIAEGKPEACLDFAVMEELARFSWRMQNVPGAVNVISLPLVARQSNAGWTEGNLKWMDLPRNSASLVRVAGLIPEQTGLVNVDCSVMPIYVFMADHKATTIEGAIAAVRDFRAQGLPGGVKLRLASGNLGIMAAVNEQLQRSETPMMIYVFVAISVLVLVTYRDWRAMLCCALPLVVATFLGYWFMEVLQIGLKVATMPVMVLAVGLGVDYAFYIYNRMQVHLVEGLDVTGAYQRALVETGVAVIFTAITMAIGVWTWSFSALEFQADMGLLLAFMFTVNMIAAVTLMPALAVVLDRAIPRRRPPRAPLLHRSNP